MAISVFIKMFIAVWEPQSLSKRLLMQLAGRISRRAVESEMRKLRVNCVTFRLD